LLAAALLLPGQSITVTSPREGETLAFGQVCMITWTSSGNLPDKVIIRLRRAGSPASEPAVLTIAAETANDGSFSWAVPASLAAGSYFVRIKATDAVAANSGTFVVAASGRASQKKPGAPLQAPGLPPGASALSLPTGLGTVDFQMVDVERDNGSGALYARLRNNGSRAFNGPLNFLVFFDSRQLDPITLPVEIGPGAEKRINLMYYLSALDMAMRGQVRLLVSADGDFKVTETNEDNNAVSRLLQKTCPIYIKNFEVEVSPARATGPYPLRVRTILRLDVIGQGDLTISYKTLNHGKITRTYHFPASGLHEFDAGEIDLLYEWLRPHPQKIGCPNDFAICEVVYAWLEHPCADGGMAESNRVSCRYSLPE
jgi:hypothetical protein